MSEIQTTAVRSQGAGGQNVNKVATAIHLRFDIAHCDALPAAIKNRLLSRPDHRITADGVVVIKSQAFRSQDRNRQAAFSRLSELLHSALRTRKRRIPTKVSKRAKQKRLDAKSKRGDLKRSRAKVSRD
ncbi:MAG: aminoacyl-tRNA hydrolase [Gammaproteobacteria bacterium]|nr:aminoacyl-tRNA hydrolase [Gammaproteobacteria bacterium]